MNPLNDQKEGSWIHHGYLNMLIKLSHHLKFEVFLTSNIKITYETAVKGRTFPVVPRLASYY